MIGFDSVCQRYVQEGGVFGLIRICFSRARPRGAFLGSKDDYWVGRGDGEFFEFCFIIWSVSR